MRQREPDWVRSAFVALGFLATTPALGQPSPMSPAAIAELGSRTWALWECSALASEAGELSSGERLFKAGYAEGRRFLAETHSREKDPAQFKAIMEKVPMILSMNLRGPNADFALGSFWAATTLYVDDEISDREAWTHQKVNPQATVPTGELRKMKASNLFRDRNCALLK